MGTEPEETLVFEDSLYALKKAGASDKGNGKSRLEALEQRVGFPSHVYGRSRPQAVCVKCLQMLMRAWHLQTLDSLFIHPIVLISGKLIDGFLVIGFVLFQDSGRKVGIIR